MNRHKEQKKEQIDQYDACTYRSVKLIRENHTDGKTDERENTGTDGDSQEILKKLPGNQAGE